MCKSSRPRVPAPQPEKKPQFLRNRFLDPATSAHLNTIGLGALRIRPRGAIPGGIPNGPGGLPTPYPFIPPTLSPFTLGIGSL